MSDHKTGPHVLLTVRSLTSLSKFNFTQVLFEHDHIAWAICNETIIRAATILNSLGMKLPTSIQVCLYKFKDEVPDIDLWYGFNAAVAVIQAANTSPVDEAFHLEIAIQEERSCLHHDHIVRAMTEVDPTYINHEPLMEVQFMQKFHPFKDGYRRVIALEFTDDASRNIKITYYSATDGLTSCILYRDPATSDFLVMERPDNKASLYRLTGVEQYRMALIVSLMGE